VMTWLNVKQNQIVKVFTIITAVFLPPTLIATFYGMNFTWMSELDWQQGFLVTTLMTLVAALIPLAYIKHKGWLRWCGGRPPT
jgi:magnesium transporter